VDLTRREALENLGLVAGSGGIALGGLEAGLRTGIVPYERGVSSEEIYCQTPKKLHQFHPEYGWTLVPDTEYIRHWKRPGGEDDWLLFRTNEDGFRDTYHSGDDTVIVLGDSFTEGAGVTQGGQYPHLLDRWAPDTAFRAFAAGGYGTDQELLVYRDVGTEYDHNLVVLQFYLGNDRRTITGKGWPPGPRRPRFELRDDDLVQVHEPVDEIPEGSAGFRNYGLVGDIHGRFRETSYAYDWTYGRSRKLLISAGLLSKSAISEFEVPTGAELKSQLKLTRALLERVGDLAEDRGAELLIVSIPARGDVDPSNPEHYPPSKGRPFYDEQREMLRNLSAGHENIGLSELKPTIKNELAAGNRMYGEATGHFTPHGYRVMAKQLYNRLVSEGYLKSNRSVDFEKTYTTSVKSCP